MPLYYASVARYCPYWIYRLLMPHYLRHLESLHYVAFRSIHGYVFHREPIYKDELDYLRFLDSAWCLRDESCPKWSVSLHGVADAYRTQLLDQLLNLAVERMVLFPNRLRVSTWMKTKHRKWWQKTRAKLCDLYVVFLCTETILNLDGILWNKKLLFVCILDLVWYVYFVCVHLYKCVLPKRSKSISKDEQNLR